MRVVPEVYRRALETQVNVDKAEPHELEEKVLTFIRNNTSGQVSMDVGHVDVGNNHDNWEWNSSVTGEASMGKRFRGR